MWEQPHTLSGRVSLLLSSILCITRLCQANKIRVLWSHDWRAAPNSLTHYELPKLLLSPRDKSPAKALKGHTDREKNMPSLCRHQMMLGKGKKISSYTGIFLSSTPGHWWGEFVRASRWAEDCSSGRGLKEVSANQGGRRRRNVWWKKCRRDLSFKGSREKQKKA